MSVHSSNGNGSNLTSAPPGFIPFGDEPWQVTRIEVITVMARAWWVRNRRNFGMEHARAMQILAGEDTAGDDSGGEQ